jgi:type IV pilus assembly protein PilZ
LVELRRFVRTPLDIPVTFSRKGSTDALDYGQAKDVSVGGMFIETKDPGAFGSEVVIHLRLPQSKDELTLPGVVRWVRDGGMGIQFGNLGAKETHEITEVVRRSETI